MKPLLIGMISSSGTRPGHELYPLPEGGIGHALWSMLNARTNATMRQYLDAFERRNLLRGEHNRHFARARAHDIASEIRDSERTVLLLGGGVREAFNHALCGQLPPVLVHPTMTGGCVWRQIPYPLGAWYAAEENRKVVELLLEELFVAQQLKEMASG